MQRSAGVAIGFAVVIVVAAVGYGIQRARSTTQHIEAAMAEATDELVLAAQMRLGPSTGSTLATRGTTIMEAAGILEGAQPWLSNSGFGHIEVIAQEMAADAYLLESNNYYPNTVNTRQMLQWVRFAAKEFDTCWVRYTNNQGDIRVRFERGKLALAVNAIYHRLPKAIRRQYEGKIMELFRTLPRLLRIPEHCRALRIFIYGND